MYKRIYKCHPKTETKSSYEYTRDEIIKFKSCFGGDRFQDLETGKILTIEEICAIR